MSLPDGKKGISWIHEDQDSPLAREEGTELRGGFFLLEGRVHLVARTSRAERRLLEQGALHFADVVFEHPHADAIAPTGDSYSGRPAPALWQLRSGEAVSAFYVALSGN